LYNIFIVLINLLSLEIVKNIMLLIGVIVSLEWNSYVRSKFLSRLLRRIKTNPLNSDGGNGSGSNVPRTRFSFRKAYESRGGVHSLHSDFLPPRLHRSRSMVANFPVHATARGINIMYNGIRVPMFLFVPDRWLLDGHYIVYIHTVIRNIDKILRKIVTK